jgi:hypothetical protein
MKPTVPKAPAASTELKEPVVPSEEQKDDE